MLRNYFERLDQQRLALDAALEYFEATELDLYDLSWNAFDQATGRDQSFQDFSKIYAELASPRWNVFRSPRKQQERWSPQQTFETLRSVFGGYAWRSGKNLLNLPESVDLNDLDVRLQKMRDIKPRNGYPHMTVSKFLHFYNPGLFPIYDEEYIWKMVFKRFREDFREFCGREGIDYKIAISDDREVFLASYLRWAASLLQIAHSTFMDVFVLWLDDRPGVQMVRRKWDPRTLFARAFEYTAIGEAVLSESFTP